MKTFTDRRGQEVVIPTVFSAGGMTTDGRYFGVSYDCAPTDHSMLKVEMTVTKREITYTHYLTYEQVVAMRDALTEAIADYEAGVLPRQIVKKVAA